MGVKPDGPFEAMLHRYRGLLFSLCRRYSRRGLEVDDLLQEASIALWRDSGRLLALGVGPQQAALVWTIARNTMVDLHRRTPATEALPDGLEMVDDDRSGVRDLREQVALLDEPDRTIVDMHLDGFNYDEIASKTGITAKYVSVRLVRAKEKLKKMMGVAG